MNPTLLFCLHLIKTVVKMLKSNPKDFENPEAE